MSSGAPQVILTPEFFRQFGIKHSASSKLSAKGVRFDSIRSQKQLKAMVPCVPEAGDIVMMDFDPQVGHEQAKRRPALVLTDQRYNRANGLTVVCSVTSQRKPYPFALPVRVAAGSGMGWRSAVPLLSHTGVDCGPRPTLGAERHFISVCRSQPMSCKSLLRGRDAVSLAPPRGIGD